MLNRDDIDTRGGKNWFLKGGAKDFTLDMYIADKHTTHTDMQYICDNKILGGTT